MDRNEILNILNFRHACKEFDSSKKISSEDFNIILESGRLSPSSMGIEPWRFLVIENQELKDKLGSICWGGKKQMPTCSHLVIYLSRTPKELKSDSAYIDYLLKDVKHLPDEVSSTMKGIMKTIEETRFDNNKDMLNYSCLQTYIALSNMMTTASMLKIDSCAIGGIDQQAVEKILIDKGLLDKEKFHLTICCAFGYRIIEPSDKLRQPLDEIVTWVK